jgi:hypothetical protein
LKTFFKFFLIISCLIFIYLNLRGNQDIIDNIFNFGLIKIFKIILLCVLSILIYSKLILLTSRYLGNLKILNSKWNLIYFNSQFLNSIPFFGILYRAKQLKNLNLGYEKFFAIYLMITWFYLFLTLLFISFEILIFMPDYKFLNTNLYYLTFTCSIFVITLPLIFIKLFYFISKKYLINKNYLSKVKILLSIFDFTKYKAKFLRQFIFLFIFLHIFEFLIFFELISGLKLDISLYKSYLIFIGTSLIDSINILPQNILISDIGYGFVTKYLENDFQLGVMSKLYMRFVIFTSSILIAIVYSIYANTFQKKLWKLQI